MRDSNTVNPQIQRPTHNVFNPPNHPLQKIRILNFYSAAIKSVEIKILFKLGRKWHATRR